MVINGIVEQGKHLGRTLGFPTANVRPDEPCPPLPVNGVYAAAFWIAGDPRAHVCMLNQGADDRAILEKHLTISAHQLKYVTRAGEGQGLIFYGNVIVPFADHFPRDTQMYRIMTTKLLESSFEKPKKTDTQGATEEKEIVNGE